jgi:hypothetical protein
MASTYSRRPERGDEDNTAFGLPERSMERKPGYARNVADREDEAVGHRRRPSEDQDIPQESLAERIARNRQEGGRS